MPTESFRPPGEVSYTIRVIGARRPGLRDAYHALLRMSWWRVIAVIVLVFLLLNAIFALLYMVVGGVANARRGSFLDAFYFSVPRWGRSATDPCSRSQPEPTTSLSSNPLWGC